MAETIGIKLPAEMAPLFDDLKEVRSQSFEDTSNNQIVKDAVVHYHKARCGAK